MSSTIPAFESERLPVTMIVTVRARPRGTKTYILLGQKTVVTEYRTLMSSTTVGKIKVSHSARIAEIYGAYSSHEVHVGLEIPATLEEIQEFEGVVAAFQERCVVMNRQIFNEVLRSVGKEPLFGTLEPTEQG